MVGKYLYLVIALAILVLLIAGCPEGGAYEGYSITVQAGGAEYGESAWADKEKAREGEEVYLTASPGMNRIVTFSAADLYIRSKTLGEDGGNASFLMPPRDVIITAYFTNSDGTAPGWRTLLFDDFADGDYVNGVTWSSESEDGYYISVEAVWGDYKLKVPRGSDYGWALGDVSIGTRDFRITWDFTRFGDSLGRPWINLYNSNGDILFRAYANSWNGGLLLYQYEWDSVTESAGLTIFAQEPTYSDTTGAHTFVVSKENETVRFFMDGNLELTGTCNLPEQLDTAISSIGLFGHGSGPSSGAYYDNIRVEVWY